ncbi:MAG: D-glycero-beta-D-manno-heptose 1,7-bisphosphate 7-phosphatase [Gammaproteobacteria bacterium]|nr:D-glycero-beta-D-manno-heptose 1,7-bisphosphate 7-phosphatase [Gammaproteobacteria bacterium]
MKLIVLDRDGVINYDSDDYIKSVDEWIPLPGSLEAIARLNRAGYTVAVATNQSGIARGYYDLDALQAMHRKMRYGLEELGGELGMIAYCPHGPDDACDCRKPLPGMLNQIAAHYNVSMESVPVVGDSLRDLEAAMAVGAHPVLVRTGKGERTLAKGGLPDDLEIYDDLAQYVDQFLSGESP